PSECSTVALVEYPPGRADIQPRDDLLDELALLIGRKRRNDFLVIENAGRNERQVSTLPVRAKGIEVGQIRYGIDETSSAVAAPAENRSNDHQNEEAGRDVDENQIGFEEHGNDQQACGACCQDDEPRP